MGMYSSVINIDLEVKDVEGLNKFLTISKAPSYVPKKFHKDYEDEMRYVVETLGEGPLNKDVSFTGIFDNKKIISYWYDGFCYFMRDFAEFVEGEVELAYEDGETFVKMIFNNGNLYVSNGAITYGERLDIEDYNGLASLPDREKLRRNV